eukprot:6739739-Alexandrium_andersonii.AAC.1
MLPSSTASSRAWIRKLPNLHGVPESRLRGRPFVGAQLRPRFEVGVSTPRAPELERGAPGGFRTSGLEFSALERFRTSES